MTVTRDLLLVRTPRYVSHLEDMGRWFGGTWKDPLTVTMLPTGTTEFETKLPKLDMYTEGEELVLKADIPGMGKDDVNITVHDNILTISGERKTEEKVEKGEYYSYERSESSFCRSVELPFDVETDKSKAHLENGVLEIRLSRTHEVEDKSTKIPITG
ncbi:MAG: Hsp20/alpha crystallin family protein [Thermodesulfovibrio sp.]|nr:Hsp20/alpha crystallin family protein [Thermodesulfovibrio sp.]